MILLREMMDDVFKSNGLDYLHIGRQSNLLTINGKCGQRYVVIYGLEVPKNIKIKERDYIFKLAKKYINDNIEDVKWIVNEIKNGIKPSDVTMLKTSIGTYGDYKNRRREYQVISDDGVIVLMKEDSNDIEIKTEKVAYNIIKEVIDNISFYRRELNKFKNAVESRKIKDEKIRELSTCNL